MLSVSSLFEYSKNLNVLYVEDDSELRRDSFELFEDYFKNVVAATDGLDGMNKYTDFRKKKGYFFDLVLTDLNMPKKNGIDMISDIQEMNPDQAIVVTSAHNESELLIKLIDSNVTSFMMKPIVLDKLLKVLSKTCKDICNQKAKEEYLLQQSRNASMGEIIDSIAHQWMQPITIIDSQAQVLELKSENGVLSRSEIKTFCDKQKLQLTHMVETLQEFRSFFRPISDVKITNYKKLLESVMLLLNDELIKSEVNIDLDLFSGGEINIKVIPSEFKHILIIIIKNSLDAFIENSVSERKLTFRSELIGEEVVLNVIDNAGGIPESVIGKIFESNFTTKSNGDGTGVGLPFALQIIKKLGGKIDVSNVGSGAKFAISLSCFNYKN